MGEGRQPLRRRHRLDRLSLCQGGRARRLDPQARRRLSAARRRPFARSPRRSIASSSSRSSSRRWRRKSARSASPSKARNTFPVAASCRPNWCAPGSRRPASSPPRPRAPSFAVEPMARPPVLVRGLPAHRDLPRAARPRSARRRRHRLLHARRRRAAALDRHHRVHGREHRQRDRHGGGRRDEAGRRDDRRLRPSCTPESRR